MSNALQPVESPEAAEDRRTTSRQTVVIPGHLTWRDARGATRFVAVATRNIGDYGAFVECETSATIPLFRLVTLQLEGQIGDQAAVPCELRTGKVQCAVYRCVPADPDRGVRQGYALRLLIEPRRVAAPGRQPSRRYLRAVRSIA